MKQKRKRENTQESKTSMVLWQEAKGIQQNKTELCSYPVFHAHTEVTQDAIREMLKSVKNQEENEHQCVCG